MMFEATAMGLMLFFAVLLAGLAVAFVGLRAVGVSSESIGRGAARVVRVLGSVPGVRRLLAFSRRHRKMYCWVGALLAICIAPFALMGVVVVVGSVVAIYAFGHLSQFVDVEDDDSAFSGYSDVVSYDETDEERSRRWTYEDLGLYG